MLDANGDRILLADGQVKLSSGSSDDCGCCTACFPDPGPALIEDWYLRHTDDPATYVWPDSASAFYTPNKGPAYRRCHRFFVWERRTVTSNVYGGASAADWILKSNKYARRHLGGGAGGPFETAPGSGIDLDTEPYWWSGCEMGGWATVASMWYQPTLAQMQSMVRATLPDGTYSLLASVRYRHTNAGDGSVIVGVTDGQVMVQYFKHQKH